MIHSRTKINVARLGTGVLAVMVLGVSLYGPLSLISIPKANAQFGGPAFEINPVVVGGVAATAAASALTAANTTAQSLGVAPRNILDALAWMLAKTVVQSLTRSIVNWINSGFQGSPAFEADLNASLRSLGDAVANDFINGLNQVVINNTGFNLRAPFQDQIAARLREEYYRTTSSYGFDVRNPYNNCYNNGNFSISGFLCQSQNPANNPAGRYQIARNELFKQLDGQVQNRIQELGWGKGFLSWRGPCGPNGRPSAGVGGNSLGGAAAAGAVPLSKTDNSSKCPIRTPGAVIENALGITVTSPIRQLELADSINEIVAALMAQMVNQVMGAVGLSGVSTPTPGGGASVLDQATNPSQYDATLSSLSTGLSVNVDEQRRLANEFKSNWQRIASAADAAKQACSVSSSQGSQADRTLTTANTAIARADSALAALTEFQNKITTAQTSTTSKLDSSTAVATEWQALLGGNRLISLEEVAESRAQSIDSDDSGSLYSQMRELQSECRLEGR